MSDNGAENASSAGRRAGRAVSFVGLGVMGYPMAGHLAAAGHQVRVYNRTRARAEAWLGEHRGEAVATPREAAEGAELVFMCVGNDDDVRQVALGQDGVLAGAAKGAVVVDHTTASALLAEELAGVAAETGVGFLDAPVSGGQAGAENGQLTVMAGGAAEDFERARPVIDAYAKSVKLMGGVGCGQLTKMVNQVCIAGVLQGLAEGIHFAEKAGLDVDAVVDVISKGAAQSWQMDNRAATMAQARVRLRLRRRLDAQGLGYDARRGPAVRRAHAAGRARRSVLRGRAGHGRPALGHLQPGRAPSPRRRSGLISWPALP